MTKRRVHISLLLMLLAILAITVFQGYWLYKSYREEEQNLGLRTNILFREMVYHLQAENMDQHPGFQFDVATTPAEKSSRHAAPRNHKFSKTIFLSKRFDSLGGNRDRTTRGDSGHRGNDRIANDMGEMVKVSMDPSGTVKTVLVKPAAINAIGTTRGFAARSLPRMGIHGVKDTAFFKLMAWSDSVRSALPIPTLMTRYAAILQKEKLELPFAISRQESEREYKEQLDLALEEPSTSNRIEVGMLNPYVLQLDLVNPMPFLLRKLTPQITVSFLLIGLTVFSFILLYRNLMQQRKLTQIKNDLISNITHELRTPIATVSVAIEALKNFNALQDPKRTREYLDISGSELQRLSLLVDKVLKLSMFEKHQVELREESFDLKQVIEEVVSSMRLQFEKYDAQVSLHFTGDDFTLVADRLHITSVIFNLLDNALKYSKENPVIRVEATAHAGDIEISISDNGVGISPGYQKKIFEKFFRVPSGNTHNVKGYGLGLSYVAYVVQRHQGKILVESELGIGSRFIIKLSGLA